MPKRDCVSRYPAEADRETGDENRIKTVHDTMQFNEKSLPEGRIQLVVNRDDLKDVLREIVTETMGENGSGAKRQDCYLTAQQVADRLGVTKTTL